MIIRAKPIDSKFRVEEGKDWVANGYSMEEDGLLNNFTTTATQRMNGDLAWRGAREKDVAFMQILIEALSNRLDIVMDWKASTGIF